MSGCRLLLSCCNLADSYRSLMTRQPNVPSAVCKSLIETKDRVKAEPISSTVLAVAVTVHNA